jgi:hypothetical protein
MFEPSAQKAATFRDFRRSEKPSSVYRRDFRRLEKPSLPRDPATLASWHASLAEKPPPPIQSAAIS